MREVFRDKYKLHGYKYFFRGLSPTVLRAFPVNAICLTTFDYLTKYLCD